MIRVSQLWRQVDGQLNLIDERTKRPMDPPEVMDRALYLGLKLNRVDFETSFDQKTESQKIEELCRVLGVYPPLSKSPDKSYELTSDNAKKIVAIHMRFRCSIPVVIMGETGSGKTRLVRCRGHKTFFSSSLVLLRSKQAFVHCKAFQPFVWLNVGF